jgi:hypothetical protein
MLRRLGDCPAKQLEEGCSSTAFARIRQEFVAVWFNLANHGSATNSWRIRAAVP